MRAESRGGCARVVRMIDVKLTSFNDDVKRVARLADLNVQLTRSRLKERRASEAMGHAALEAFWDERGITIAGGVGGVGRGHNGLDAVGYKPGELHIGHCHGGTSRAMVYASDGRALPAGSAPSVCQRLLADPEFLAKMRDSPALWRAVAAGQVTIYWDMVFAPSGRFEDVLFTSTPLALPAQEIAQIDAAIVNVA